MLVPRACRTAVAADHTDAVERSRGPHERETHSGPVQHFPSTQRREEPVANIKSQIKRNKQNEKAHERNKAVKTGLKTAIRKFREAAAAGDKDNAIVLAQDATKKLDKAASKGVIHKNQAANRKSSIAKQAASL
jgi:small subunit ribosomal protein S20